MRYKTKTFQLIENYLKTCCDKCFRAHDVYDYIVANEMKVNISTVYRNLEQFVEAGQLIKYKSGNNDVWMYRLNQQFSQCHEHLHLQCKECGKIIHIKKESMDSIIAMLEKDYKFFLDCDIYISRRTVTKYREECFIYNSRQRKIEKILWEEK